MKKTLPRKMAFDICPVGEIKSTFQFNFFIIHIDDDVFSLSHIILIGSDCSINRGVGALEGIPTPVRCLVFYCIQMTMACLNICIINLCIQGKRHEMSFLMHWAMSAKLFREYKIYLKYTQRFWLGNL